MTRPLEARLQRAVIHLRARHPFFGALALLADPRPAEQLHGRPVLTACTDGARVYVNPRFARSLSDDELSGLLVHEVLHAALRHVPRGEGRDQERWNIAADIVVNGIAVSDGHRLPAGAVRRESLEHLGVEEIYELLSSGEQRAQLPETARDLFPAPAGEDPGSAAGREQLERYWRDALQNAAVTARLQGPLPGGAERALRADRPRLDWRGELWRYLTPSRSDFGDLDRRLVHRALYLEDLTGHELPVAVCVDTSGSVGAAQLAAFLGEVHGILGSYPHLRAELYYADVALHGPYNPDRAGPLPAPRGGGGTDFRPFFEATREAELRVYLTDGHGTFPEREPSGETLWVVPPGGLRDEAFAFGRVLRLH